MQKTIIWFRNDLRLADNDALSHAVAKGGQLIFLYIFNPENSIGAASKWFLHHALEALKKDLKSRYNAQLLIRIGDEKQVLDALIKQSQADSLLFNKVFEPLAIKRDNDIENHYQKQNIEVKSFNSSLFFDPNFIKNGSGEHFKVFTPFWKSCLSKLHLIPTPLKVPSSLTPASLDNIDRSSNIDELNLLPKKPNWAKNWG
ncbi:MAG: deoxyribodipyrimidine photo-lyase, partial [Proteobacteria bacterium]|nr:deoxyribodipyrimidine photo-lyase [Pseudomonadota bacterium]